MTRGQASAARASAAIGLVCAVGVLAIALERAAGAASDSSVAASAVPASAASVGGDVAGAASAAARDLAVRRFAFDYRFELPADPSRTEPMQLFVPLAVEDAVQRVHSLEIDAPIPGAAGTETAYGNRYWHAVVPPNPDRSLTFSFRYEIERKTDRADAKHIPSSAPASSKSVSSASMKGPSQFLGANEKVLVAHPILDPILEEVRAASRGADREGRARAIFDWVVDNVEYKKVGTGWGNGDTFWACNERYGNCTDFHSLFISLARTEGIPARFEMGFPIPEDRAAGEIAGYHCWVEFWLPETGWFPIDASEAFKQPDKRELYYGTQPADRLHLSTGRDLRLGPDHAGPPLNYFVYPYAEVAGTPSASPMPTEFRYRAIELP